MQGQIYPRSGAPKLSYQRPSDWLPLPIVQQDEEKFVGLFAVFNTQSNFVAVQFDGDYTVDWGDGVTENFASGVIAEHSYVYSNISPSTLTSRGYRQVIVTVTPQSGSNLTSLNIDVRHSNAPDVPVSTYWLDVSIGLPNAGTGRSLVFTDLNPLGSLEIVKIADAGLCSDFSYLFDTCSDLKQAIIEKMDSVEDISSMFYDCSSLVSASLPDCPSAITTYYPFEYCHSIKSVIIGDISSLGDFSDFFYDCFSLESVQIGKIAGSAYDAFAYCHSLETAVFLDLSELTDAEEMFYACYSLRKLYFPASPMVQSTEYMFEYCYSLREVEFEDLTSVLSTYAMFYECFALTSVILPEMPAADYVEYMFEYCYALQSVDLPPLPVCDSLSELFSDCYGLIKAEVPEAMEGYDMSYVADYCYSLQSVTVKGKPGYCFYSFDSCGNLRSLTFEDCSQVYETYGLLDGCHQLAHLRVLNLVYSLDISNCFLSRDALVQVFQDLGTVVGETITVTGNWGAPLLSPSDLAIASGKGWIVTT